MREIDQKNVDRGVREWHECDIEICEEQCLTWGKSICGVLADFKN